VTVAGFAVAGALAAGAPGAPALSGNAPLYAPYRHSQSHISPKSRLAFRLPSGWSNALPGSVAMDGVYGEDDPVGAALCRATVVIRGQARRTGVVRSGRLLRVRFGGRTFEFRPIERKRRGPVRWYRSSSRADEASTPPLTSAMGVAVRRTPAKTGVPRAARKTVVLGRAYAAAVQFDANGVSQPPSAADGAACRARAPQLLARGLRATLSTVTVVRRRAPRI
jgi:hypothetical protein